VAFALQEVFDLCTSVAVELASIRLQCNILGDCLSDLLNKAWLQLQSSERFVLQNGAMLGGGSGLSAPLSVCWWCGLAISGLAFSGLPVLCVGMSHDSWWGPKGRH
jgi:hypothetical protein